MLTVGGLFSGIGGWELGLERAGMRVLWHCDAEAFARRVLAHHWPDVPCYKDVRALRGDDVEPVDIICGGFPCQDISAAGRGAGIAGGRSSLWSEYARLVGELQPRYVLVENVALLRRRGLDTVLGDLATLGYDAEWDCLRAAHFGAPHRRDRLWLVAYPGGERCDGRPRVFGNGRQATVGGEASDHAGDGCVPPHGAAWPVEPDVGRVATRVPDGVDRRRALGNALVPQIAEWIGRRIIEWESSTKEAT